MPLMFKLGRPESMQTYWQNYADATLLLFIMSYGTRGMYIFNMALGTGLTRNPGRGIGIKPSFMLAFDDNIFAPTHTGICCNNGLKIDTGDIKYRSVSY